jgi:hypothetical protein
MPDIILTVVSGEPVDISLSIPGVQGPAGQPAVASGGTTGQLLAKASSTNYQTSWTSTIFGSGDSGSFFGASPVVCPSGISIPSGGSTTEEVLTSLSGVIIALRNLGLIRE